MGKANRRYHRSIVLGVLALGSLVWVATDQYGIPRQNMAWMLAYTVIGLFAVIAVAAIAVGIWMGLRKLIGKRVD